MSRVRFQSRNRINLIDQEILTLLEKRAKLSIEIGKLKENIYDKEREKEVIERIKKLKSNIINDKDLIKIYKNIIKTCRSLQKKLFSSF